MSNDDAHETVHANFKTEPPPPPYAIPHKLYYQPTDGRSVIAEYERPGPHHFKFAPPPIHDLAIVEIVSRYNAFPALLKAAKVFHAWAEASAEPDDSDALNALAAAIKAASW